MARNQEIEKDLENNKRSSNFSILTSTRENVTKNDGQNLTVEITLLP